MTKRFSGVVALVLLMAASAIAGAVYQDRTVREEARLLKGRLTAVAFRPNVVGACDTDAQRVVALGEFTAAELVTRSLPAWMSPRVATAQPASDCSVLTARHERERRARAGGWFGPRPAWALIVNTGEGYLVDAWQNIVELETMKFHGAGTGATAAAEGDTALQTESTTILNPDSTRATGSLTEASQSVFRTVGTLTFDGAGAITEWGLLSQAATGGGVLWSRIVFSAINVASGDSIQFTYDLTVE